MTIKEAPLRGFIFFRLYIFLLLTHADATVCQKEPVPGDLSIFYLVLHRTISLAVCDTHRIKPLCCYDIHALLSVRHRNHRRNDRQTVCRMVYICHTDPSPYLCWLLSTLSGLSCGTGHQETSQHPAKSCPYQ